MVVVTFDGPNKLMNVISGTTNIDVEKDLYSDWKEWILLSDNAKYLRALRTTGGDPTNAAGTSFSPKYFFLMNGWRVKIDGDTVIVERNLYVDEGGSPFIVINDGGVTSTNSDAQVIENSISEKLDYAGIVHVNVSSGEAGVAWPVGTLASPVNSISQALVIANHYNIKELHLHDSVTFNEPVMGYRIAAKGDVTIDLNNQMTNGTTFRNCSITGIQNSSFNIYISCRIETLSNFAGTMTGCFFMNSTPITVVGYIPSVISDCRSAIAGNASPVFDFVNNHIDLSVRAYSGGIEFINSVHASNKSTTEFIAGKFNFQTSNTLGEFHARGVCDVSNINSGGALVYTDGLVSNQSSKLNAIHIQTKNNEKLILATRRR